MAVIDSRWITRLITYQNMEVIVTEAGSIAQLFDLPEYPSGPGEKSNQVVGQEVYDSDMYTDILQDSPTLQETAVRGSELLQTFESLLQDVFISLFKLDPVILPEEDITESALVNRSLMEVLFNSEDFQRLRTMTVLDPLTSILGTQVIGEKTIQKLESDKAGSQDDTGNGQHGIPFPDVAGIVDAVIKEAVNEVTDTVENLRAWGINPGAPGLRVSFQNKRKALEKLRSSQRLQKLTNLIGRFRSLARQVYRIKGSDGTNSINSVTTGGDLEKVLPSEKMMLGHQTTKLDFMRRYNQRELLQYKNRNNPAGRGPLVTCCDVSGSMSGKPEEWSKATMLAMAEIAQRQKRDYACILFNTMVVETWVIPRGTWNPAAIIDMAEVAPSGGTNFEAPLSRALEIINESRFRKADVVFITDGHCRLTGEFLDKFNQTKQRKGFMVFTVLINIDDNSSSNTVERFSDEVITLSSLAQLDEGAAETLFNRMRDRALK